ncbi:hypothetical protein QJS04_geneDACA010820 [Acorus gramineus]|uniref:RanBD1 domain-containing protein n=1 Tax=Acorus gramineus TaxID=55184 RepID=A0AAV9BD70_ACOGR|nr:hypothetical protein QJS04_geneDACA010820 [Acorus gramineus]
MKRGYNRLSPSDSIPDSSSFFKSKRVIEESPFGMERAESSRQHLTVEKPASVVERAELSRQHVRALNAQFVRWAQSQLQKCPDDLWEDGVRDYLTHASHIKEKFNDVVDWLGANAAKAETKAAKVEGAPLLSMSGSSSKNMMAAGETFSHRVQFQEKNATQAAAPLRISSSWNSNLFSNGQTRSLPGAQTSNVVQSEASNDGDDLEQPSSPSLKKTEEKGITVVHEVKCKVYVKPENPTEKGWKDMGTGQLSIKCKEGASKASKESKPTILIRNDVGKILLNALIYAGIRTNVQKNTVTAIFHTAGSEGEPGKAVTRTYLLRTKTQEETKNLDAAIKEYAPAS